MHNGLSFFVSLLIWCNNQIIRPTHSICSSFELLADESRDLSQAEKKIHNKVEQIHKTTAFDVLSENNCHFLNLLSFDNSYFLLSNQSRDSSANRSKLEKKWWGPKGVDVISTLACFIMNLNHLKGKMS